MRQPLILDGLTKALAKFSTEEQEKLLQFILQIKSPTKNPDPPTEKKETVKPVIISDDKQKYEVSLKFINSLLKNMGKPEIKELTDFKNISREDIISESNKKVLEDMAEELFVYFNKYLFGWYRRSTTKNYVLTFIRKMCNDLGLVFKYEEKHHQKNKIWINLVSYSILKSPN